MNSARWQIIQAANKHKVRTAPSWFTPRLFGMRQLQQAVCVARRNRLVSGDVLMAAGFRAR